MHKGMNGFAVLIFLLSWFGDAKSQQALSQAKALASETVNMMGGMDYYNATRYIGWNFFGKRQLLWDKPNNRVRVDLLTQPISIIASLTDDYCIVFQDGVQVRNTDTLSRYLRLARQYWMNDSYWLVMPFKLFDPGVLIQYAGRGKTTDGRQAEILQLTSENVGVTPHNKYLIYIDFETRLIAQWDYFKHAEDTVPAISNPWTDYRWYGNIRLASGRGTVGSITDIHVWDTLPPALFQEASIPDFNNIK